MGAKSAKSVNFLGAYLETAVLAIIAVAPLVATAHSLPPDRLLDAIYPSGAWSGKSAVLLDVMAIYSAGFAIAAVGSFFMLRYRGRTLSSYWFPWSRSVCREVGQTCKWFLTTGQMRRAALWITLVTAIGATVRSFFLAQPMRYGEAYTFLRFVNVGFLSHFYYPLPNNHVLHTLLVRVSVGLFGSHPVAIRLPAFLAGVSAIPLTFCLSRSLSGDDRSGYFAAGLVAVFPYLILFDAMARGYSIVVVLTLCLVALGMRVIEYPSMRICSLMALVIALGVLDMPSFVFPAAGVLCWTSTVLLHRGRKPAWVLANMLTPCSLMAVLLIGLFYTPVVIASNGIDNLIHNEYVMGRPWQEFLTALPTHISSTAQILFRNIPALVLIASLLLLVVGYCVMARERRWTMLLLLPAVTVGGAVVLFAQHAIPFARTWIYLLPLTFILMDASLVAIAKSSVRCIKTIMIILTGCAAILAMSRDVSTLSPSDDFPEAPTLVDFLSREMTPADHLVAICPTEAPMRFYMWYRNVPREELPAQRGLVRRVFFVVKPSKYSLTDILDYYFLTNVTKRDVKELPEVLKLLEIGDAELYVTERPKGLKRPDKWGF